MTRQTKNGKVAVIVDGISSGAFLAPAFAARGVPCVHVMSRADMPEGIRAMMPENLEGSGSPYLENIVFGGDMEAVVTELEKFHVIGVVPGMELSVPFADTLSERMGLPGNGTAGSAARRNKYLMQRALRDAGVPTKRFICTDDERDVLAWAGSEEIGEVVIKPMDSAGTDGVRFCTSPQEILDAFRSLRGTTSLVGEKNSKVLAEERLVGTEFGVNTVSWDGKHRLAELWQYHKVRVEGAGNVYDCTRLRDWPGDELIPLVQYAFRALDALGVRYGPAHTEIMLTAAGPLLVESGARVMGGTIPPELIRQCAGQCQVDLVAEAYSNPAGFVKDAGRPYHLRRHMIRKHLIAGTGGEPGSEIAAVERLAGLKSCVRGDFVHLISDWYVHRTVDMVTSPAKVFLLHKDPRVILADYQAIREYETGREQELFGVTGS